MKKTIASFVIACAALQFASFALAKSATVFPERKVPVPELSDKNSFTWILFGDPQSYLKYNRSQPLFELTTAWVSENIERLNIKSVLCVGDIVEQNNIIVPKHGSYGDQISHYQWEAASRAWARLDEKIPYIITTGNHDFGYKSSENRMTQLPKYFPTSRNSKWQECLVEIYRDGDNPKSLVNAAFEFDDKNWNKILVLVLEYAPRDVVLEWAKKLLSNEKYKNHKVFLLTHSYLTTKGELTSKEGYKLKDANAGVAIYEKLIKQTSNIVGVFCGHTANGNQKFEDNVAFRIDKNAAGKNVYAMMFNVQTLGGGWDGNGGDGWVRILEFMPDGKTIKVKTYSPLFGISPTTEAYSWRKEPFDEFEYVIE